MAEIVGHRLPPALRRHVAAAYGYRAPANPAGLHRGLPSRHLTLVVELLAPLRVTGVGGAVAAHGVLGGLHPSPVLVDAAAPQEGLQYALTAPGVRALLGLPAGELRGQNMDLLELLGPEGPRLVEEVRAAPGWSARFAAVDAALLRLLRDVPDPAPELLEGWRLLLAGGRVGAVAAHVGWSRRHLAEQVRRATGLTPVEAVRIARFETARRLLLAPGRARLADVAAASGYADQAHLAREWRTLAGCTVTTWLREELPFVQDTAVLPGEDSSP